jgi:hypothetical protein
MMTEDGHPAVWRTARHSDYHAELEALTRSIGDLQTRMQMDRWYLRKIGTSLPNR